MVRNTRTLKETGMSQIEVDAATLHQAANTVRTTRTEVDGELKNLLGVVEDLSAAWAGQAATGFQNLFQRWNADVTKLLHAMDEIADLLDKSGTQHTVNDTQQQQALDRIQQALNP
jgi:WXG100 family type VII secretion target